MTVIRDIDDLIIEHIDKTIFESEEDVLNGSEPKEAIKVFEYLDKKYFG